MRHAPVVRKKLDTPLIAIIFGMSIQLYHENWIFFEFIIFFREIARKNMFFSYGESSKPLRIPITYLHKKLHGKSHHHQVRCQVTNDPCEKKCLESWDAKLQMTLFRLQAVFLNKLGTQITNEKSGQRVQLKTLLTLDHGDALDLVQREFGHQMNI